MTNFMWGVLAGMCLASVFYVGLIYCGLSVINSEEILK